MAKQIKNNTYDELHELREKVLELVVTLDTTVNAFKEAEHTNIPDREQTSVLVKTIEDDAAKYRNDVEKIFSEHKDWHGRPKRAQRFMVCHSIGVEYLGIMETITSATLPLACDVLIAIEKGV
jgi:hypothetical protein